MHLDVNVHVDGSERPTGPVLMFFLLLVRTRTGAPPMSPIDIARQVTIEPLPGRDGLLLAKTIVLARELQRNSNGGPFVMAVCYVQQYRELSDLSRASEILRQLERRGFVHCERRGTKSTDDQPGVPTLWRFRPVKERLP